MGEEKTSKSCEAVLTFVGFCILLIIVSVGPIALFGSWFEANEIVLKDTAKAQEDIRNALLLTFNDFGRLEVRRDYSMRAYISKKNYMFVPYPDRDEAITSVGKIWCENKGVFRWYLPGVILRDIQTGEELSNYSCLFGFVNKK